MQSRGRNGRLRRSPGRPVWRVLAFCGLSLVLTGCLGEGTQGGFGFLSDRATKAPAEAEPQAAEARKPLFARKGAGGAKPLFGQPRAKAKAPVREARLVRGKVAVVPPRGYCIDPRSLRRGLAGGFALIAACNSLTGEFSGADVEPVVMTVQVQPGLLTRDLPSAAELAAALAPAKAIAHVDGDGLTLVQLDRGGDSGLPTGDPRHWRGAMLINGYLVGLALYAPKGSALAGRGGQRLILQLAENLLDASPIPDFTPQARQAAKKKKK